MTLLLGVFAVALFLLKIVAVIVMAIYHLIVQMLFGIDPPHHDKYKAFDPVFSPQMVDEPSVSKSNAQANHYERTERAKYLKALEQQSEELPF
jgi:hypothetical protein